VHSILVCGIDEAGRGPLAGPVYAAAVILDPDQSIRGLADSKALSEAQRDAAAEKIRRLAIAWAIASATVEEIDSLNILQATLLAMRRAVDGLHPAPGMAVVDGNQRPKLPCRTRTIVGGDNCRQSISAASILAKTARDAEMRRLHALYPVYGLDRHKGYATREHLQQIELHGACEIHRRSFAPVQRNLPL
jgi:ribonuclease HII